jgi:formiminoglutamate deiminase
VSVFWCEQAWLGSGDAAGGAGAVVDGVVLTIADDRITHIERGVASAPAAATRLDGLTLPGLANAHSHAFHRALRGRTHRAGGTFWTWREQMYELASGLDPDRYQALATATFAEMVLSGYTCVGEFHYLHHGLGGTPYGDANEIGHRLIAAADDAGIRLTLLDACYLTSGIAAELSPVQTRFSDGSAEAWVERVDALSGAATATCRIGAAIHSVRAVPPGAMGAVAAFAAARDAVVHAHVSEQPQENAQCLAAYRATPTHVLDDVGALSPRFTAVHATHVSERDIEMLAACRSRCCVCPTTERDLADGIGPTAALGAAGVEMCLGSDSHAVIDPFEEARAVELNQRLATLQRGTHQPVDLLVAATAAGYDSLGWSGGGRLAVGAPADLVAVSFAGPRLAGADRADDPLAAVVFSASAGDVRDVVVAGEHVVRDGLHQRVDVPAALESSIAAAWTRR